ncbi:Highly reducing polyketide synthase lcsB [Cladobotryum mycophilum]|uniref:Highly reducing polyketide synthase lcsB n=1 Tax=Cladobotryum mycophilum TaxID=491253 RepID=A0ABR0SHL6_9HYPO
MKLTHEFNSKVEDMVNHESAAAEPMAIVGMAMRLPGGVYNADDFWRMLIEKRHGLCEVPPDRYNAKGFHDPSGLSGTIKPEKGYFLKDVEIQQFDTSFFSLPKTEVEILDPAQRQLLEVAYECMEDAGATSWQGSDIGCYVGVFGEDWQDLNAKETQQKGGYRITSYSDFAIGNRLSHQYDLHGPSMAVKTGCSSSLVGLDMACEAIRKGECKGALVCGVSLIFSPTVTLALAAQGILSSSGPCKTFDATADGYGRGEAINAIYIKKLSQALMDGDSIRAIIRGTSVNTDGQTNGMMTPSPIAQEALIRRTYEGAGITNLGETAIVECHGTGTAVGDPLEASAVAKCFGDEGVIITSVKPNVGHSEGAAGLTSVIKAVLAIEHRKVPPNIFFNTPNPSIPFDRYNLHVPITVEEWPQGRAERISVNSFGVGGTNAHVILESLEQYEKFNQGFSNGRPRFNGKSCASDAVVGNGNCHTGEADDRPHLLLFSSNSHSSLEESVEAYKVCIQQSDASLKDVAYTLANRRDHMGHRAYAVAGNKSFEISSLGGANPTTRIAWIFTGQGAQWPGMGSELLDANPVFQSTIRSLDKILLGLTTPFKWTIEEELRNVASASRPSQAETGHVLVVAVQLGLVDMLHSWGMRPDWVLGHSSGEIAAAYASGAITAEAAISVAALRSTVTNGPGGKPGVMAALGLGPHEVGPYMEPGVVIACENSQSSVTVAGDSEQVEKTVQKIKKQRFGILARLLRVERAYHSPHMREYGPSYEAHLLPIVKSTSPMIPFFSSVTGKRLRGDGCLDASYWRQNMQNPVIFNTALRSALSEQDENTLLVEVGPHPALSGPIHQILRDLKRTGDVYSGTLQRDKGGEESILQLAGKLFQQHLSLKWSAICPPGRHVSNLPRHCWKRDTAHWTENRIAKEWRFRDHPPHELLGARVIEVSNEPWWRQKLSLEDVPWLSGHEVDGRIVFPGAGYVSMIGEALRQLHAELTYSLRNISIIAGLVLEYGKTVEIVTKLTPIAIDLSEQSPWYTFSISSYDGTKWIKHCVGEARASMEVSASLDVPKVCSHARKVDENEWYGILKQMGYNYTGMFRGLRSISTAPNTNESSATVETQQTNGSAKYAIHPAVIDKCFQLFTVSAYRGLRRNCGNTIVPTFIKELIISPTTQDLDVTANITTTEGESFVGDLTAQAVDQMILSLKGFKATALTSTDSAKENMPLIAQFEWRQHAAFSQLKDYIHPVKDCPREFALLEELSLLCSLDHLATIKPSENTPAHLLKFFAWMQNDVEKYRSGVNKYVPMDLQLWELSQEQRRARIEAIMAELSTSKYASFAAGMNGLLQMVDTIFTGETHPLHVLMKDNVLTQLYLAVDSLDYSGAVQLIAHENPRLRVLEIGAGTGGTTTKILRALKSPSGERMYSTYTYTDISAGFMVVAKDLFLNEENIEYTVLDISQDPVEQGFQLGNYDLIIGSNVVHATPSLQKSLGHLRSLLSPGGRIFLLEVCSEYKFLNYVMGFLPGWWLGADDNRVNEPYVSPERWVKELVSAGFKEPNAIVLDSTAPYHLSACIIASADVQTTKLSRVTLLCYAADGPYVKEMKANLETEGMDVDISVFGQSHAPRQVVISLLDLQEPIVHGLTKESFRSLLSHLKSFDATTIWVTRSSQVACEDPRAAMILGLARTARSELSIQLFTVELDNRTAVSIATEAVTNILLRTQTPGLDARLMDPDWEYAIIDGKILIPRLHWNSLPNAFAQSKTATTAFVKSITVRTPGLLNTMAWSESERGNLGQGQVLVQTKTMGLNFKDVLIALGVVNGDTSGLGFEGCGIVIEVGPDVQNVSVGDKVIYLWSGCFTTHLTLPQASCIKTDDSLAFEQLAAMPSVYATAALALVDKANLQSGQTILIHSACGGVGLAAIQIAQMLGAEVYCTVSNEEKRRYLVENHNIPQSHIFNSRDSSFLLDIMRATKNIGVDVVLNSLSGPLLHDSWSCVAEFGAMIEIGKRDFQRRAKLSMDPFEQNRTFIGLDLWHLFQTRPEKVTALVERCLQWIQAASQIQEAFRFMQSGRHIGKIVIKMPEDINTLKSTIITPAPVIHPDRSYLLVGGLGGLGRAVGTWMVEQGARYITFLSRSAKLTPELQGYLDELNSLGCQVQLVAGSVSSVSDVKVAVLNAPKPIAGVINFSMVLKDVSLSDMSFDDWTDVTAPKVEGTWNLHNAISSELDFFILCASYSGIIGQHGQANYAAANTFLDAFVQYRHYNGLAASVIDIGIMGEIGFVWKNTDALNRLQRSDLYILKERDFLNSVNLAMQRSKPGEAQAPNGAYGNHSQILLGLLTTAPIASCSNRLAWKRDVRMSIYHNTNNLYEEFANTACKTTSIQDSITHFVASAAANPAILEQENATTIIARAVAYTLASLLIKEESSINIEYSPTEIGIDSLVAMELRNWIHHTFSVEASTMTIVQGASLMALGEYIKREMIERLNCK